MYSVKDVAEMLGIKPKQVYRYIEYMKKDNIDGFVNSCDSVTGVISVNDTGLDYIKERRSSAPRPVPRSSSDRQADNELVAFLYAELRAKDEQIAKKDEQIATLLQLNQNSQVLLQQLQQSISALPFIEGSPIVEPVPTEKPSKKHWWQRSKK